MGAILNMSFYNPRLMAAVLKKVADKKEVQVLDNPPTKEDKKEVVLEALIRDRLHRGDSLDRAVALAGNAMQESGGILDRKQRDSTISDEKWFDETPTLINSKGKEYKPGRGTGLLQWDDRRRSHLNADEVSKRKGLKEFADERGESWKDLDVQLDFLDFELKGPEKRNIEKVNMEDSVEKQTRDISKYFLRPGDPHNETRVTHAKKLKEEYKDMPEKILDTKIESMRFDNRLLKQATKSKMKKDMDKLYKQKEKYIKRRK